MKILKWDNLKERIAKDQYTIISEYRDCHAGCYAILTTLEGKPTKWRDEMGKLADIVYKRIMGWDIRMAHKLMECFPAYFSKWGTRIVEIDQDNNADWFIVVA